MHYYSFNIGDYASSTAHLEPLEDLAYRRLLDLYYSSESAIADDLDKTARLIRMRTHSECIATVLSEFFTLEIDGWHCERADIEIFKYNEKSYKASKSAKARWKKAKVKQRVKAPCERIANAEETQCDGNAKQEPLTTNQEPVIKDIVPATPKRTFSDGDLKFVEGMLSLLTQVNPKFKVPNKDNWANTIRLMRERDGLNHDEMAKVFTWANNDHFWSTNILSADKFRDKWNTLLAQSTKAPKPKAQSTDDWDDDNWHKDLDNYS